MKSKCLICTLKDAKYKCPTCYLPFCSVACGKSHKTIPCQRQEPAYNRPGLNHEASDGARANDDESTSDGVVLSSQQLCALNDHEEIQRKIRDERLMAILERIDKAPNSANALQREMRNPAFLEFCDDVLEALEMKEPAEKA